MAITSLKSGISTRSGMAGNTLIYPGSYESIATVDVGAGGTASITFSSIPATYTHLQIRGIARNTYATTFSSTEYRFNSDSGSNYAWHYLYGDGASAFSGASASDNLMREINLASGSLTSGIFSGFITDILDYANTNKNKTIRTLGGADANGSGGVNLCSGVWMNTSAINSVTITASASGTLPQYSSFALYGVN
jgi:hypothetical protein